MSPITVNAIPTVDILDFAAEHDLEIIVNERRVGLDDPGRFYASFKNGETKDGSFLRGDYGNGATVDEAIAAYARAVSTKRLVIDAYGARRREMDVPRLTYSPRRAAPPPETTPK